MTDQLDHARTLALMTRLLERNYELTDQLAACTDDHARTNALLARVGAQRDDQAAQLEDALRGLEQARTDRDHNLTLADRQHEQIIDRDRTIDQLHAQLEQRATLDDTPFDVVRSERNDLRSSVTELRQLLDERTREGERLVERARSAERELEQYVPGGSRYERSLGEALAANEVQASTIAKLMAERDELASKLATATRGLEHANSLAADMTNERNEAQAVARRMRTQRDEEAAQSAILRDEMRADLAATNMLAGRAVSERDKALAALRAERDTNAVDVRTIDELTGERDRLASELGRTRSNLAAMTESLGTERMRTARLQARVHELEGQPTGEPLIGWSKGAWVTSRYLVGPWRLEDSLMPNEVLLRCGSSPHPLHAAVSTADVAAWQFHQTDPPDDALPVITWPIAADDATPDDEHG